VLAVCGGLLGTLFAFSSLQWIHILGTKTVPRLPEIGLDLRVLLFTLLLATAAGILFGLAPAARATRLDLQTALKQTGRGSAGMGALWGRGNNARKLLVISELALSVVLLTGAGLLVRSIARLQNIPPGFDPKGVLTFDLTMAGRKYADSNVVLSTYRELWQRLAALPGVSAAGGTSSIPLSEAFAWTPITIEGRAPLAGEKFINADARVVAGDYFRAMAIPLRSGRFFNEHDTASEPRVVIIDEHMAQEYWPNQDPIGKRIHIVQLKSADPWQIVVGVVGTIKQDSLDSDPRIAFYMPHTQNPSRIMTVTVRSTAAPTKLAAAIKNQIRELDREMPLYSVRTMQQRVDESLARRKFFEVLLSLFAVLALALAAVGIYGVMSYLVSQGSREIGIRIAMGATQGSILTLVVRQGMTLALIGLAVGLAGALTATRLMRSLLFGVEATDAPTFLSVSVLLTIIALAACTVPALRASRVDAVASLGSE
jgi:predicted permease